MQRFTIAFEDGVELNSTPLCIVDLCGTLVPEDTTLGLLRFHFRRVRPMGLKHAALMALTFKWSPIRLAYVLGELISRRHLLKTTAVRLLNDELYDSLVVSSRLYAEALLLRRNNAVWAVIQKSTHTGHVILASASLEPIVAAVAQKLGARYVASSLSVDKGVLTGQIQRDITGAKSLELRRKFGPHILDQPTVVISDNLTDLPLLRAAAHPYVVLIRPKHRARWATLDATYISPQ